MNLDRRLDLFKYQAASAQMLEIIEANSQKFCRSCPVAQCFMHVLCQADLERFVQKGLE